MVELTIDIMMTGFVPQPILQNRDRTFKENNTISLLPVAFPLSPFSFPQITNPPYSRRRSQ
ncbi:MAG: hypothetical protein MUD14_20605 [Hydrococcus sp. Prado102]|nr:hypothetical protein [Hydrococcus sp. Prado102]